MYLRPISFISISTVSLLENLRHIFVGELATVSWSIGKISFRKYLWGVEFTVILDYSGIQKFFGSEANAANVVHSIDGNYQVITVISLW